MAAVRTAGTVSVCGCAVTESDEPTPQGRRRDGRQQWGEETGMLGGDWAEALKHRTEGQKDRWDESRASERELHDANDVTAEVDIVLCVRSKRRACRPSMRQCVLGAAGERPIHR